MISSGPGRCMFDKSRYLSREECRMGVCDRADDRELIPIETIN